MENIKQKIVLPTRGVCNTTPDPICEDNELEDCVGFSYSDEAIRPIQDAKKLDLAADVGTLQYVHRLNDGISVNHIFVSGDSFIYGETTEQVAEDVTITGVSSVGNTLLVNTERGVYYFLWYNGAYENLGNKIPEPDITFRMKGADNPLDTFVSSASDVDDLAESLSDGARKVKNENIPAFYDAFAGAYALNKKKLSELRGFHSPFFVCYALELYDGSFTMASNPILMLPTMDRGTVFTFLDNSSTNRYSCKTFYSKLQYHLIYDFTRWADIVKNISVFVSREVEQFNLNPKIEQENDKIFPFEEKTIKGIVNNKFYTGKQGDGDGGSRVKCMEVFELRPLDEVTEELTSFSNFYKISEIKSVPHDMEHESFLYVTIENDRTIENLTTQKRLEPIDFYSHCVLSSPYMTVLNRRLNLANITRTFFEGFKSFMPIIAYSYGGIYEMNFSYRIKVTIKINGVENFVEHQFRSYNTFHSQMWYYYPDPRATHVKITKLSSSGETTILDADLTEHKGLNGAYYFGGFMSSEPSEGVWYECDEYSILPEPEHLGNTLAQSEADNPFVFSASGYVRVGQGAILGLAALTTALSNDAYKVATTIAFTTQGIWGLEIDGEGVYKTVPPSFSREVCSNPKSITMVDNGIYYVSKRGLMVISDNANGCVTTQICGKSHKEYDSFTEFIQNCTCAYDYRDSQLWLINPDYDFHWVYSIKSGTLSRKEDGHSYEAVVSDYPDTLLQAEGSIFSMYQEPNINDDETLYSGFFITRPMKFEQAMALKSLRDLKHIKDVSPEAEIDLTIYASDDCASWQQLPSLKGRGFKYFKFRYDLTNLKAADAFCGTVLYYTTRETDRIR